MLSEAEIYSNRHPKFLFSRAEINTENDYLKIQYPSSHKPQKPSLNWKSVIVDALGSKCAYWGAIDNLHIDHIIPLSKHGEHKLKNMRLLCKPCHAEKTKLDGYPSTAKLLSKPWNIYNISVT